MEISILLVENDSQSRYLDVIHAHASSRDIPLRHFLEPKIGLSSVRNRAFKEAVGDNLLIVDDDQVLSSEILHEFMIAREKTGALMIYGSNPPQFESECPLSISWFFYPESEACGKSIPWAPTNCLWIDAKVLAQMPPPWFDEAFDLSGGEDIDFTHRCVRQGFDIVSWPKAIAWEYVPSARCNLRYILARSRRDANVGAILGMRFGRKSALRQIISLFKRLMVGIVSAIPCLAFTGKTKYYGMIKLWQAAGMLEAVTQRRSTFYAR